MHPLIVGLLMAASAFVGTALHFVWREHRTDQRVLDVAARERAANVREHGQDDREVALLAREADLADRLAKSRRAQSPLLHERVTQAQAQPIRPGRQQPETWMPRDDRKPATQRPASHDMVSAVGTDTQRRPESPTAPLAFDQLKEMLAADHAKLEQRFGIAVAAAMRSPLS